MNIFVLDPSPKIAASMHCDQHLHKMILESAQMLSTIVFLNQPKLHHTGNYYKPTHPKHPCTIWLMSAPDNITWMLELCAELDNIRRSIGADRHSSMSVIDQFFSDFTYWENTARPESFIFCGPVHLQYNSTLTVPQKYQRFYHLKKAEWESQGRKMTWNGRAVPEFMNGESK